MELWIANCTKQVKEVPYRLPGNRKMFEVKLEPGQQVALPHDLNTEEIEAFVKQHAHYGVRDEKTVKNVKEHIGLLYSIGKPVKMDRIVHAIESNDAVLTEQGSKMLEQTLLASDRVVQQQTEGQGKVNSLEIMEERPKGSADKKVHHKGVAIGGRRS